MSEEYWQDLGRRAVACKGWRWTPGMKDAHGGRLGAETDAGFYWVRPFGDDVDSPDFPDLRDPATLGCLLALVREAWSDDGIATMRAYAPDMAGQWSVYTYRGGRCLPRKRQATEAEALLAALEAAP